jgi:hypothetical protein
MQVCDCACASGCDFCALSCMCNLGGYYIDTICPEMIYPVVELLYQRHGNSGMHETLMSMLQVQRKLVFQNIPASRMQQVWLLGCCTGLAGCYCCNWHPTASHTIEHP